MSLAAIGIISKNIDRSLEFYKLLGVDILKCGDSGHYEGKTSTGLNIMLDSVELIKKITPDYKESSGSGIILCFQQEKPEDVNELYEKIITRNFKSIKEPWDAFWGQRYSCIQDPDGNQIDIFSDYKK